MISRNKEFLSFSSSMLLQCLVLYAGICAGLWINIYFFIAVAAFTVLSALCGKINNVYYHLLFCLPFTLIYKFSPSDTSFFAYLMLIVGIVAVIKARRMRAQELFLILIFTLYVVLGMGFNVTLIVKMIMGLALLYTFVRVIEPDDFKNQIMAFSLGMVGSSFIGLLKDTWPRLTEYFSDLNQMYVGDTKIYRFSGLYLDPNYFSISAIFAIALCMMLFLSKNGNRILLLTIMVTMSVFGFLSYSKMFLLALLLLAVMIVLYKLKTSRFFPLVVVSSCLGYFIIYRILNASSYLASMEGRFEGDISTGRFDIWNEYLTYIWSSPRTLFFGDGLGAGYYKGIGPHNTYIESIYFLGIFGSIILIIALVCAFRSQKNVYRRNMMNYSLVLLFILMIATLGCLTINDLFFYCMLLWIGFNMNIEKGVIVND